MKVFHLKSHSWLWLTITPSSVSTSLVVQWIETETSVYLSWQVQGLNLEREAGLRDQEAGNYVFEVWSLSLWTLIKEWPIFPGTGVTCSSNSYLGGVHLDTQATLQKSLLEVEVVSFYLNPPPVGTAGRHVTNSGKSLWQWDFTASLHKDASLN